MRVMKIMQSFVTALAVFAFPSAVLVACGGEAADVTARLQGEIDAAFRAGGGTVTVESGEWAVRGVRLRSNVTLLLKAGAVLRASRNCDDFDVLRNDAVEPLSEEEKTGWPEWLPIERRPKGRHGTLNACSRWNRGIITVYRAHDVRIVGEKGAVIDGCNSFDPQGEEGFRGVHGIVARDSDRVALEGFEIRRTGNWATRFFCCRDVSFRHLTVIGGHDGVHVRRCDRVTVDGCTLHCGDDCIAGFDNRDVTVENCDLNTACSAFRFGGRHVRIRNCRAWGPGLWPIRNSLPMEDRAAGNDCQGKGRHSLLSFFTYFADLSHGGLRFEQGDIVIENCTVEGAQRFLHYNFSGNERWQKGGPLADIAFRNCRATEIEMSLCAYGAKERPLSLTLENCDIAFKAPVAELVRGAWVEKLDVRNVRADNVRGPLQRSWGGETSLRTEGLTGASVETVCADVPFKTGGI